MKSFDRVALIRFWTIAKPFFVSDIRWKACGLLLLLGCFSISVSAINVLLSFVGRDFMTALSLKERDEFFQHLIRYLAAFALATPVVVMYRYTEERLGLAWRRWLSHRILERYLKNRSYYLGSRYPGLDNLDQRIEVDIRSFTSSSLSFLLIIFNSVIGFCAFIGILYSISIWLVLAVLLYAAVGSVLTFFLGRPLISLNFAQLKKDADYRYKLINIRDNAESIAFYRGEKGEFRRSRQRLKKALDNLLHIINWNRNLNFFTTGYNFLISILPTVIVAPLYLDGFIEFGVVTQANFAFGQVLGALSIIVLNFGSLSAFAAVVNRLGSFWEMLDDIERQAANRKDDIKIIEAAKIKFNKVTIVTPSRDQVLVKDLSFELERDSLLITGSSGSGKSSLVRAIAGLWTAGSGEITRPALSQTIFLPQRPYMILGPLRSQLIYALDKQGFTDKELYEVIEMVELEDMLRRIGGLNAVYDWPNVLSTGEQQRLAFARLLLAKPRFAFLDESSTALDARSEERMYKLLKGLVRNYVSVGYHSTLSQLHDQILVLKGNGVWSLECPW